MENKNFFEEIFIQKIKYSYVIVHNFKIKIKYFLTYWSWKHYIKLSKNLKPKTCPSHSSYYHRIIFDGERRELRGVILFTRHVRYNCVRFIVTSFFSFSSFFFSPTMPQLVTFLGNFSSPISKLVRSGPSLSTFVVDDQLRRHEISTLNYLDNRFLRLFFSSSGYDAGKKKIIWKYYQEIIFCHIYCLDGHKFLYFTLQAHKLHSSKNSFRFFNIYTDFFLEFSFDYIFSELRSRWISINKK